MNITVPYFYFQGFAIVDYAFYCQRICQDICEATGWKVFTIKPVSHAVKGMGKGRTKNKAKTFKKDSRQ